jgi:hypothetical protein
LRGRRGATHTLPTYDVAGFEVFRRGRIWVFGDTAGSKSAILDAADSSNARLGGGRAPKLHIRIWWSL